MFKGLVTFSINHSQHFFFFIIEQFDKKVYYSYMNVIRCQLGIYNVIRGQWMSKMLKRDQSGKILKMQLKTHFLHT